jgi:hypothetical protein
MGFKEDEIRPLDEHARRRPNIRAARSKAGIIQQAVDLGANDAHHPRRCRGILGRYRQPDILKVALGGG